MYKLLAFILFLSVSFSAVKAETVKDIQINGNKRVSDETVKIYGEIKNNVNYKESDLNKILNNLYGTNFFENVNINLINGILKIDLIEYPIVNELLITGEPSTKYTDEIKKRISTKRKDSFIKNNLSNDVSIIKRLYSTIGYNFVKVETQIREIDNSSLDLIFEIDKGKLTKISKISFTGEKKIREKRLRDVIASEEDKFWKFISKNTKFSENLVNLDLRLLKNYYNSLGYYDAQIISNSAEIKESGNVELIYSIQAGTRYIIKKIDINVDSVFDKELFYPLNKKFKKIVGEYYSPFKIKILLEDIDDLIDKNSLQFVEHNVEENIEGESIAVKFNVYEGEKVLVERINILGNNVTNETVIRSELLLDEGDPFTNINLDKSIAKIKSRNIFNEVTSKVSDGSENNLKIIDINVEEKPTGEISAGAGVGTNGGSVAVNVAENNWLGEGKNMNFSLELDKESVSGGLSFVDPNYDNLGNSLRYFVNTTTNEKPNQGYENVIVSTGISTSFEQYKNVFANLGLEASYDDLKTLSNASDNLKKQSGTFNEVSGVYGFTLDERNRSFMPTDGSIVSFNQTLPIYADKKFISNRISASSYKSITENVIGAAKFHLAAVSGLAGDDVRVSKRTFLSTKKLRGFKNGQVGPVDGDDHIGGNYSSAVNFEASLPNLLPESTKTDIGMFWDFGNVWGVDYDSTIDDSNKIRSSAGVAASWISPLGPMTFVLSQSISKAATDKTERFNFNLGTTF